MRPALVGAVRFDRDDRPRNSLFALTDSGTIDGVYDKWHLVPFGEYQPDWFPARHPGRARRRTSPAARGRARCRSPALPPVGPLICYEAIFPGQVVDAADRPAWMVNITNDAWFGDSSGPRQHLAAARMRAVEEGLPLLRAANTGITAAFDARGHELAQIERADGRRPGGAIATAPCRRRRSRDSGWSFRSCFASCVLGLGLLARRRREQSDEVSPEYCS